MVNKLSNVTRNVTFNDIINILKNTGAFARRKSWDKNKYIYLDESNNLIYLFTGYSLVFNLDDYYATDWVYYEERNKLDEQIVL